MSANKLLPKIIKKLATYMDLPHCLNKQIPEWLDRISDGIIPSKEQLKNAPKYDRVVIFGIDGAGGYYGEKMFPNFERIFAKGSVTYSGMSQFPTTSAHNWTSMLHGVRYQTHKICNEIANKTPFTNPNYPSVMMLYAKNHPDAKFASIVNWASINVGIVENDDRIFKWNGFDYLSEPDPTEYKVDNLVTDKIVDYLQSNDPAILFLQLDAVDHAGHVYGYGAPEFASAIAMNDECVGKIYDVYKNKGLLEKTLFILVSDHGHKLRKGGGHGQNSKTEREVTVAVAGGLGNVIKGTPGKVVTQDIAAITLYALGEPQPDNWECAVPKNMFKELQ